MKKLSYLIPVIGMAALFFIAFSTGCGKKGGKEGKHSDKENMLMANSWKLDVNGTIKTTTDSIKDTTGVTADIQLNGDVGAIADFIAETMVFAVDNKDKTKLSYSRTIGEGLLSSKVLGFWNLSEDQNSLILREWDNTKGELPGVTYKIVELTADKLVLQKDGDAMPTVYKAVK